MTKLEKVIKGLECHRNGICDNDKTLCPYWSEEKDCSKKMISDTLELLKEKEAVEPYIDFDGHDVWRCGKCGATIFHIFHNASDEDAKNYAIFCRHCGNPVLWKGR